MDGDGRDREGGQGLVHDQRDLDVVVQRERAVADDVDIDLVELAEAALLGALSAPDLLDLVPLEGEVEDAGVIDDVAGEGDGEVEVQAELPGRIRAGFAGLGLQAGTGGRPPWRSPPSWSARSGARRRESQCR